MATVAVCCGLALIVAVALTGSDRCSEINELVDQMADGFVGIRSGDADDPATESLPPVELEGATNCSLTTDVESTLYLCTWEYAAASGDGPANYEVKVDQVRSCVPGATVTQDESVNHPDYWASTRFSLADGALTVSLKNKSALGQVLVTVGAATDGS